MDGTGVDTGDGATWASGDYGRVGNLWPLIGELLCEAAAIRPGERVLDVATGTGNTALAAARRFATVTGVDYVPELLEHATARAAAEGLPVSFETGDAERMRFADASFDVAVSTFGVQYVPDQDRAAAELLRVVRPGGRIALASWSPDGFLGELLRLVGAHTSGHTGPAAPTGWGTEDHLEKLLGPHVSALTCTERRWLFRFPGPDAFVSYFRAYFGPLTLAYEALSPSAGDGLTTDLVRYVTEHDQAPDGTVEVPSTYLQAVAVKA
ncbi:class I SAM-dependent methyltransferase [Actinomadura sp. WMMB 499]|uniref:class I SAM-dependent methyltransferase n=1 Tax=Actinomadura sp. WMMB 499 TaxID=1219491 RepID=UPI00159E893F|nr:methyltransferase domain-containing protein [Actinomadura sp. WMMB 499]